MKQTPETLCIYVFTLQELQLSINRLGERCAPWLKIRLVGEPTMTQITSAVDRIVYDDGLEDKVCNTIICVTWLVIRSSFVIMLSSKLTKLWFVSDLKCWIIFFLFIVVCFRHICVSPQYCLVVLSNAMLFCFRDQNMYLFYSKDFWFTLEFFTINIHCLKIFELVFEKFFWCLFGGRLTCIIFCFIQNLKFFIPDCSCLFHIVVFIQVRERWAPQQDRAREHSVPLSDLVWCT